MSEFLHTNSFLLLVYTNKNSYVFNTAAEKAAKCFDEDKKVGIIYDDFNADPKLRLAWEKKYKNMKILSIAPRIKTLKMDDKIFTCQKMSGSKYLPNCYYNFNEIPVNTDPNQLYFVKKRSSTGSKGVSIVKYKNLESSDLTNTVIQENISKPDLYDGRRYKIRMYTVIYNKNVYFYHDGLSTVSAVPFVYNLDTIDDNYITKMNIIYQSNEIKWFDLNSQPNRDAIFENMILSMKDFEIMYKPEIEKIEKNEFAVLGLDYIVDIDNNVQIIEINHRSNYQHPREITEKVDVSMFVELFKLFITDTHENTDFVNITTYENKENIKFDINEKASEQEDGEEEEQDGAEEEQDGEEEEQDEETTSINSDELNDYDNEILSKLDINTSKVIKMKNKQFVYIREDNLGGLLYDPEEFTQYKEDNDFKIKNYGRLEIKEGKYYFKENI